MLLDVGDRPRRVAVVGVGGAGKTTFAVELGRRLDLPVVHLDRLYWRPGWDPLPADEGRAAQEALVRAPMWVVDTTRTSGGAIPIPRGGPPLPRLDGL